jgi:putative nucleotidyltransferase with HDIG domain
MNRLEAENFISNLLKYDIRKGRESGTWYKFHNHVYGVAKVAEKLAEKLGLDTEKAYILGLMHDCGKVHEMYEKRFHGVIGYEMFKDTDSDIAKVSLTHSFYNNLLPEGHALDRYFYGNQEDKEFVISYINESKITEYDRIIQFCDGLANCNGLVTLEERAEEFASRYNFEMPEYIVKNAHKMKEYFDDKLGFDVYNLFNEIDKNFMLSAGKDKR